MRYLIELIRYGTIGFWTARLTCRLVDHHGPTCEGRDDHRAAGGKIAGNSVPIIIHPGEQRFPKEVVDHYGEEVFRKLASSATLDAEGDKARPTAQGGHA